MNRFFYLLLLISASVSAQNTYKLIGTITDKSTGIGLPQATVYIKELKKGSIANANGEYELAGLPKGNYTLLFSYLGYQTATKKVSTSQQTRIDISLREQAEQISEVIVSAKTIARKSI